MTFKKGQSGNPKGGRPKSSKTWAAIIKSIGAMTPMAAAARCKAIGTQLAKLGNTATMKELAVLTAYAATLYEPQSALLNFLATREEGNVPVDVNWKHEIAGLLSQGKLTREEVIETIGTGLARELFEQAGIATTGTGETAG